MVLIQWGEVKAARRCFGLALRVRRRAAVGGARHGGATRGAAVPMDAGGGSRWKPEVGADVPGQKAKWSGLVSVGVKERRKWAESQRGCSINSFFLFLNFKLDFRFKNQRFEILLN
jgi:hypothetical protein